MKPFAYLLSLLLFLVSSAHAQFNLSTIVNPLCADFRILGPCTCTGLLVDQVCQLVSYHQPSFIVEVVPIPGDSYLGGILSPGLLVAVITGDFLTQFSGGSGAAPLDSGHNQLTFREAHVYSIPQTIPQYGCGACDLQGEKTEPKLHYASELDFVNWRYIPDGIAEPIPLAALQLTGVWGSLFPRMGLSAHDSEPVGAALLAWRALTIAFDPAPGPGGITPHNVIEQAMGIVPTCFQVGLPTLSKCGLVGMNPILWQLEKVEPRGRNVFVFWEERTCCIDPETASCGLEGAALNQDNFCPLGYDPVFALVPGMPPDIPFDGH